MKVANVASIQQELLLRDKMLLCDSFIWKNNEISN